MDDVIDKKNIADQRSERPKYGSFVFLLLLFSLIGIDQYTKILVFQSSNFSNIAWLVKPYIGIWQFYNNRFAFSLPVPAVIMYAVYTIILLTAGRHIVKNILTITALEKWGWLLIFAGALSNIGERIYNGSVKDFIYLFTGIFNLADFYIILGILFIIVSHYKKED